MKAKPTRIKTFSTRKYLDQSQSDGDDSVAIEEPMEIRLVFGPQDKRVLRSVSVTMRTPGNDEELAAGFLFSEGILSSPSEIDTIEVRGVDQDGNLTGNIIRVVLQPGVEVDFQRLQRNFLSNSSCGVCGKASLESLEVQGVQPIRGSSWSVQAPAIYRLSTALRSLQPTFDLTGGIHAAAFADTSCEIIEAREDVGRHNAVDKLIGTSFLRGELPAQDRIMVVSGRASFEIVQKAIVAGVPMMVAVGAPSSLAVEMAQKYQMTLVGFASERRFNVYSCNKRIGA